LRLKHLDKILLFRAQTFRQNPTFSTETAISELGVGEALVSFLNNDGTPSIVERAFILPPKGKIGPIDDNLRRKIIQSSIIYGKYEKVIDRESAFEILKVRADQKQKQLEREEAMAQQQKQIQNERAYNRQYYDYGQRSSSRSYAKQKSPVEDIAGAVLKSAARSVGYSVGRKLVRGILGSLF